jgi:hypothetical protein
MIAWLPALAGGALIGAAVVLLYGTLGRIAGVSNIAYGAAWAPAGQRAWRWAFLGGLVAGGWLAAMTVAALDAPAAASGGAIAIALAAGVLVGIGTRLGNGCTSGHGVCGLARLSPRSLVAVVVFMGAGMATATLLLPVLS